MTHPIRPIIWLRYAGLVTWLLAVTPLLMLPLFDPLMSEMPSRTEQLGAWAAAFGFLAVFWPVVSRLHKSDPAWLRVLMLGALTIFAAAVSVLSKTGVGGILTFIVAALVPWMLPLKPGLAWVMFSAALQGGTTALLPDVGLAISLISAAIYFGMMLLMFMASYVSRGLHYAQGELRRVNSQLRATQALLAENTRIAERVRIARELHDLIGHHLTALTLNMEVASHLCSGRAREHVEQGRSIAKLLLSDVREVVSDMRRDDRVNLARALRELVAGMPEPTIHLEIPEHLPLTDPARAQILLRCAQEVITNAARHAQARNLWITLKPEGEGFELCARDDGRGADTVTLGNGLTGMRERLRELGGRLNISTRPGAGFSLQAWMPREGGTA